MELMVFVTPLIHRITPLRGNIHIYSAYGYEPGAMLNEVIKGFKQFRPSDESASWHHN